MSGMTPVAFAVTTPATTPVVRTEAMPIPGSCRPAASWAARRPGGSPRSGSTSPPPLSGDELTAHDGEQQQDVDARWRSASRSWRNRAGSEYRDLGWRRERQATERGPHPVLRSAGSGLAGEAPRPLRRPRRRPTFHSDGGGGAETSRPCPRAACLEGRRRSGRAFAWCAETTSSIVSPGGGQLVQPCGLGNHPPESDPVGLVLTRGVERLMPMMPMAATSSTRSG